MVAFVLLLFFPNSIYATPGYIDTTFNPPHGFVTYDNDDPFLAYDLAIQSDGKIIVTGYNENSFKSVIMRYRANGTLDSTFGAGGIIANVSKYPNDD